MTKLESNPDWLRLQRKIFSRWVNLKVSKKGITCSDVVTQVGDGHLLVALMEVLAEKTFVGKMQKEAKMRPQQLDNVNSALKFALETCGVQMKLKPSNEDLVDGQEKAILGLVWAIMLKFIKIGDEEEGEQLNAKDALLMWITNKVSSYGLKPEGFGKDFHDGMILCALIHKHRPKLINWESLNKENKKENLQTAIDAAEKYFHLEKYLTPEDIPKLDENSMVVYLSEYYSGIAEQTKLDLAARRISKVIKLTEDNDAKKAKYNETASKLKDHLVQVEKILNERTIDNTMAGAKRKIEEFYKYKTEDKNRLIKGQLEVEAIYNNLAMKLSHNKRPEYVPPSGLGLKEIESAMSHLESVEQERKVALHAELNRQIKLEQLHSQHTGLSTKLGGWTTEKDAYLTKKEAIDSVSGAQLHLRLLDAYDKESAAVQETTFAALLKLGTELQENKYEKSSEVEATEKNLQTKFSELGELSKKKRPVLEDDLAREQFKEKVRLMEKRHADQNGQIEQWTAEKETYLKKKEEIHSLSEARTQVSLLETYEKDKVSMTQNNVSELKALGADILAQKYSTSYSSWVFETPEVVKKRESTVDEKWQLLSQLSEEKKKVLEDDVAREDFAAKTRLLNRTHIDKHSSLSSWVQEKENYLKTKEAISSVGEALTHLSLLEAYTKDKESQTEGALAQWKKLGADILAAKYATSYSSYVFETPEEVKSRESQIDEKWKLLTQLSEEKKKVLDDDLAREEYKEKTKMMNRNHVSKFDILSSWISEKEAYLKEREAVSSLLEAETLLSLFSTYEQDKVGMTDANVAQLNKLGAEILARKYETSYSSWAFETPEEVKKREGEVQSKWTLLSELSAEKKKVLDDHKAREEFKERVRLMNRNHIVAAASLTSWSVEKENYLKRKEEIDSISQALTQLILLEAFDKDRNSMKDRNVEQLKKLGAEILGSKYSTSYSSWALETPEEVQTRESQIDQKWTLLSQLSQEKKKVLEADLAREQEKERLRLEFAHLAAEFLRWGKETSDVLSAAHFGFNLEEVEAYKASLESSEKEIQSHAGSKQEEYEKVWKKKGEMGVTSNMYTTSSPSSLEEAKKSLLSALSERTQRYEKELANERRKDALCKEFASVADPFSKWILEQKDTITKSKAELEEQLGFVDKKIADLEADSQKFPPIRALSTKMEEEKIFNNKHTSLTLKDLEVQWEQYKEFLQVKKSMLTEEINTLKLRGITPEQFKEIEEQFKSFDSDKSNTIDKKELKACLFSLGQELSKSEIEEIMTKFGKGGVLPYDGFREFMIGVLGVSDGKEEILSAFKLINRGAETATVGHLEMVMSDYDITYFKKTAQADAGAYNYQKWAEEIFAR